MNSKVRRLQFSPETELDDCEASPSHTEDESCANSTPYESSAKKIFEEEYSEEDSRVQKDSEEEDWAPVKRVKKVYKGKKESKDEQLMRISAFSEQLSEILALRKNLNFRVFRNKFDPEHPNLKF